MADGVDNYSYRKFIQGLRLCKNGHRLAEVMVNIVTGGFWPRQRVVDETRTKIDVTCHRCRDGAETAFH
eukprot:5367141-Pyramimonas_sp.AAC.1